jgi:hypothetical protein
LVLFLGLKKVIYPRSWFYAVLKCAGTLPAQISTAKTFSAKNVPLKIWAGNVPVMPAQKWHIFSFSVYLTDIQFAETH